MATEESIITVGEFKRMLKGCNDDVELYFSGLDFYRLKMRGDKLLQVEFNQQVYRNSEGNIVVDNLE